MDEYQTPRDILLWFLVLMKKFVINLQKIVKIYDVHRKEGLRKPEKIICYINQGFSSVGSGREGKTCKLSSF